MNHAPANEMLVSLTNIILRSSYGKIIFPDTTEGEEHFDKWQNTLLECSRMIHISWDKDSNVCEKALDVFEKLFSIAFIPAINKDND